MLGQQLFSLFCQHLTKKLASERIIYLLSSFLHLFPIWSQISYIIPPHRNINFWLSQRSYVSWYHLVANWGKALCNIRFTCFRKNTYFCQGFSSSCKIWPKLEKGLFRLKESSYCWNYIRNPRELAKRVVANSRNMQVLCSEYR